MNELKESERVNGIMMIELEPQAKPGNPFDHDLYHMGRKIGKDHYLMYPTHANEPLQYLILVDVTTGKRTRIQVA